MPGLANSAFASSHPEDRGLACGYAAELSASLSFGQIPPGIVFVPVAEKKSSKNRLHLDLACDSAQEREQQISRFLAAGARRIDVGQAADASWDVFADPEGNEFCMLSARQY
ncbi:VOC family protein [Psychromicrobium lacuslunae]|uniref:VOC family protein n=1 Tax=Psychromicrobium lacuslunae TaxID=1618207 RepID=UPI0012FEE820|nr:VOC family protein [Psychromicrobium lacuslunae]